jgi:hypothetical protein
MHQARFIGRRKRLFGGAFFVQDVCVHVDTGRNLCSGVVSKSAWQNTAATLLPTCRTSVLSASVRLAIDILLGALIACESLVLFFLLLQL